MKRIKIMLLSLLVLATVGGVLAFKAKDPNYCVYKKLSPTSCPLFVVPSTTTLTTEGQPIFTFSQIVDECPTTTNPVDCSIKLTWRID